jgi:hypothetical protein
MSLTREHRQEDLSFAYISAVVANAGYNCSPPQRHDYGIDIEIGCVEKFRKRMRDTGHRLHIQAKASHNFTISGDGNCIIYDLKADTYNDLILKHGNPVILVLYCMPSDEDGWLSVYEECTTLRHCGYWISLRGMPASTNKTTIRIEIPKEQMFTDKSLKDIMDRIKGGRCP